MDILPRSNFPSYIEGTPAAKKTENTPYINLTIRVESNGQSNDAAMPGPLGKIPVMPPVPLVTSTFNKSSDGLGEYCETKPGKLGQVGPKKIRSCEPHQADGNQNPASTPSRWQPQTKKWQIFSNRHFKVSIVQIKGPLPLSTIAQRCT